MKLKIPPAIQFLIFIVFIWATAKFSGEKHIQFEAQKVISEGVFIVAAILMILAIYVFQKANTTMDPARPEKATKLVTAGVFKFTRNPMYLGMFLILLAFVIRLGNFYTVPFLILFLWYITTFQIKPEEKVLTALFGEEYISYCDKVRRWI